MTSAGGTARKPWYRKWWVWAIVAAVLVVGTISYALGGGEDGRAMSTPTPTLAQPTSSPSLTTEAAEPEEPEEPVELEEPLGDRVRAALLTELGVTEFYEAGIDGRTSPLWAIVDIETMYAGTIRVVYQEPLDKAGRDEVASQVFSLTAPTVPDLDTVVVTDTSGVDSNHYR